MTPRRTRKEIYQTLAENLPSQHDFITLTQATWHKEEDASTRSTIRRRAMNAHFHMPQEKSAWHSLQQQSDVVRRRLPSQSITSFRTKPLHHKQRSSRREHRTLAIAIQPPNIGNITLPILSLPITIDDEIRLLLDYCECPLLYYKHRV